MTQNDDSGERYATTVLHVDYVEPQRWCAICAFCDWGESSESQAVARIKAEFHAMTHSAHALPPNARSEP